VYGMSCDALLAVFSGTCEVFGLLSSLFFQGHVRYLAALPRITKAGNQAAHLGALF
jgi:hypothetical protein